MYQFHIRISLLVSLATNLCEEVKSLRHRNSNSSRPFANMLIYAELNLEPLPAWSFHVVSGKLNDQWWQDFMDINVVTASSYEYVKSREIWPLNVSYASGDRNSGYKIVGYVNSSNFVDKQINGDEDTIQFFIATFDTDPSGRTTDTKVTWNTVFPCDEFAIAVSLKHYTLIDRLENPCRNDYPTDLKRLLKYPLDPTALFNSILAPDLPYDQRTCEHLCVVNYWLPICKCMMLDDIFQYAGSPANVSVCPYTVYNNTNKKCATKSAFSNTPPSEYERCGCYRRCEGFSFVVSGYDKIHHTVGSKFCAGEETQVRVKVFYTDLSYEVVEETESYPKEEMINELAGVCGLYFGFSVISLASFLRMVIEKFRRVAPQRANEDLEMSIRTIKAHKSVIKVLQQMQRNHMDNVAKTEKNAAIGDKIKQLEFCE